MAGTSVDLHFLPGDPAHDILTLFLDGGEHSPAAIAALTRHGLAESTLCTAELVNLGLLDDRQPDYFRPGIALRLNAGGSGGDGPGQPDVLSELVAITGGCARIGALHGAGISYVQASIVPGRTGRSRRISFGSAGLERTHQSALGQVLLAYAGHGVTDELRKQISVPGGSAVTFDPDELEMSLSVVQLSGVAMTRGEPPSLDVAVPVFGPAGEVEIALQISASGFQDADASALDSLRSIAKRLSRLRNELPG